MNLYNFFVIIYVAGDGLVPGQTCLWAFLRDNTAIKVWGVCCVQGAVSEDVGEHTHYDYIHDMNYMICIRYDVLCYQI